MITYTIKNMNLYVSSHPMLEKYPEKELKDFNVILNVSDEYFYNPYFYSLKNVFYYPIEEFSPWNYGPFYWSSQILQHFISRKDSKILVHCYAGSHRSASLVYVYLRALGNDAKKTHELMNIPTENGCWMEERLDKDIKRGYIPKNIIEFEKKVIANPQKSMRLILNDMEKII